MLKAEIKVSIMMRHVAGRLAVFVASVLLPGVLILMAGAIRPAVAAVPVTVSDSHSSLSVVAEVTSYRPGEPFWLALTFTPRDHWHTYWRNPGDSGMAPDLTWQASGAAFDPALYPVPALLPVGPLMNYGYEGPATQLVRVMPDADTRGVLDITLNAEWLVCEIECVPQGGGVSLSVAPGARAGGDATDTAHSDLFSAARAALPEPSYWDAELSLSGESASLTMFMTRDETARVTGAYFFPGEEGTADYAAPQVLTRGPDGLTLGLTRFAGGLTPERGDGLLLLTFADGMTQGFSIERSLSASSAPSSGSDASAIADRSPAAAPVLPLWQAALFALLGGVILNLMPCVFPILSLKAFSLIASGDQSPTARRVEGWAYTGGIMASFGILVAVLVILRAGGAGIGWGFQLQDPVFVAVMVIVMVLVGLSLSGLFHFRTGFEGTGQGLAAQGGPRGAFFTGVLATLVATPCTAPLMAPAIGFALTQSLPAIVLVFAMLAFGLALPFLILSHVPAVARLMPKPGPWMETLKQALAFPMYLTAVWLMYVFNTLAGGAALIFLLGALVVLAFAIWLWQQGRGRVLRALAAAVGLFAVGSVLWQPEPGTGEPAGDYMQGDVFSLARLSELRGEGEPVFAYFTADWCITCKVNERVALYRAETETLFRAQGVRVLKGDFTSRDKAIADILASYGRAGVPLYLYFPSGASEAIILPEILTPGILQDTIISANGRG